MIERVERSSMKDHVTAIHQTRELRGIVIHVTVNGFNREIPDVGAITGWSNECTHLVALFEQGTDEVRPYESCGTSDKSAHSISKTAKAALRGFSRLPFD